MGISFICYNIVVPDFPEFRGTPEKKDEIIPPPPLQPLVPTLSDPGEPHPTYLKIERGSETSINCSIPVFDEKPSYLKWYKLTDAGDIAVDESQVRLLKIRYKDWIISPLFTMNIPPFLPTFLPLLNFDIQKFHVPVVLKLLFPPHFQFEFEF